MDLSVSDANTLNDIALVKSTFSIHLSKTVRYNLFPSPSHGMLPTLIISGLLGRAPCVAQAECTVFKDESMQ